MESGGKGLTYKADGMEEGTREETEHEDKGISRKVKASRRNTDSILIILRKIRMRCRLLASVDI